MGAKFVAVCPLETKSSEHTHDESDGVKSILFRLAIQSRHMSVTAVAESTKLPQMKKHFMFASEAYLCSQIQLSGSPLMFSHLTSQQAQPEHIRLALI